MSKKPEPCSEEAREEGCTCRWRSLGGNDPDAHAELDEWCPVHGRDQDEALEDMRDREPEYNRGDDWD
jgi:hypothetical protein